MGRKPVTTRIPARVRSCEVEAAGEQKPTDELDGGTAGVDGSETSETPTNEEATGGLTPELTPEESEAEEPEPTGPEPAGPEPGGPEPGRPEPAAPESHAGAPATASPAAEPGIDGVSRTPDPAVDEVAEGVGAFDRNARMGMRMQRSLNVLINTIPGEVLVLWAALEGAAELYGLPVWAYTVFLALAAVSTPVYVYRSIDRPDEESTNSDVRWWQEANVRWQSVSATGAFLVWAYYLGGPFAAAGLQNAAVATVLVLVYPVLIVISPYYGSMILYFLSGPDADEQRDGTVP